MERFYEIGVYGWDGNSLWFFTNEQDKTKEQLEADLHSVMKKYGKEYIDSESCHVEIMEWVEYIIPKMAELGYKSIKPICAGFNEDIIGDNEYRSVEKLINAVGIELFTMAKEKNNKLESDEDNH